MPAFYDLTKRRCQSCLFCGLHYLVERPRPKGLVAAQAREDSSLDHPMQILLDCLRGAVESWSGKTLRAGQERRP